jgi:branched-subunit amino acid aminotransferase/4-amino-4-deoxychorismate lyase
MVNAAAVWLDGELIPPAEARVSIFDHGYTVGDGVFETLKVVDGRPFALSRHLARLHRSATGLGLSVPLSDARLRAAVDEVVAAAAPSAARMRISLTGGQGPLGSERGEAPPTLVIIAGPQDPWPADPAAVTVPWPRNERSAVAGLKTTSYAENVVALAEANKVGATEAILPNTAGNLCEGTGTNVFVHVGGRLLTPSLLSGCLAGEDMPMAVLAEADEVWITSSTRDVQPLRDIDGRALPGAAGPVAQRAIAAMADLQARDLDP